MIDLQASASEASFLQKALKKFGLPTDFGQAISALSSTIRDHKHFENLLTSTDAADRQMLYDSVIPHLRFKAKPLDVYVSSVGQRAEREQWPTVGPDGNLREFKPASDVQSVIADDIKRRTLVLTCSKCTRQEGFIGIEGETNVHVIRKARVKGWIYDSVLDKEICPKCPTSLRANA